MKVKFGLTHRTVYAPQASPKTNRFLPEGGRRQPGKCQESLQGGGLLSLLIRRVGFGGSPKRRGTHHEICAEPQTRKPRPESPAKFDGAGAAGSSTPA